MSLIDDIKRDREAGTTDFHWIGDTLMANDHGEVVELFNADWSSLDEFEVEHKSRFARVPQMEDALLAAEELADAVMNLAAWQQYDSSRAVMPAATPPDPDGCTDDAKARLEVAIAAYRAAIGAA